MNRVEYLLTCLQEECGELIQASSKSLRFGLNDRYSDKYPTNKEQIIAEFNDIVAIMRMLKECGIFGEQDIYNYDHILGKMKKVDMFMDLTVGTLEK